MWFKCIYSCAPFTLIAAVLLFMMQYMLLHRNTTFEVLSAKHQWDVKEKAECCRNAGIFYLICSLILWFIVIIDSFIIALRTLPSLYTSCKENGIRTTFRNLINERKRRRQQSRALRHRVKLSKEQEKQEKKEQAAKEDEQNSNIDNVRSTSVGSNSNTENYGASHREHKSNNNIVANNNNNNNEEAREDDNDSENFSDDDEVSENARRPWGKLFGTRYDNPPTQREEREESENNNFHDTVISEQQMVIDRNNNNNNNTNNINNTSSTDQLSNRIEINYDSKNNNNNKENSSKIERIRRPEERKSNR